MDETTITIYRPWRLLLILPIVYISLHFNNPVLVMLYTIIVSAVTASMFPWVEHKEHEPKTEENQE